MQIATLDNLVMADDFRNFEAPEGFDHDAAVDRLRPLQPELERLTGLSFEIREAQDASFFASLNAYDRTARNGVVETFIGVCFSAFGNLFCIWSKSSVRPMIDEERLKVAELVCSAGFLYVPDELLDLPYSGVHFNWQGRMSWGERYFDFS
jgi:hypothetical protein